MENMKFARQCDITGEGINEGFVFNDGDFYCASSLDALDKCEELGYNTMEEAFEDEAYYWTEWNDEEDFQYQMINGVLTEIED